MENLLFSFRKHWIKLLKQTFQSFQSHKKFFAPYNVGGSYKGIIESHLHALFHLGFTTLSVKNGLAALIQMKLSRISQSYMFLNQSYIIIYVSYRTLIFLMMIFPSTVSSTVMNVTHSLSVYVSSILNCCLKKPTSLLSQILIFGNSTFDTNDSINIINAIINYVLSNKGLF